MGPMPRKHTILVASKNPKLADVRKQILEEAGFNVIPAMSEDAVRKTCEKAKVDLVMIGYSLLPAEKRRVWKAAREFCKTPILELYENGTPELMQSQALFVHQARTPHDFLDAVRQILSN